MITKPMTMEESKNLFLQMFLATTNKVTKVTAGSVLNAVGYGVGKVGQKISKDIAILESNIFPEAAFGALLDAIALRNGIPARFGALEATTYVRLVADPGTTYTAGTHSVTGRNGIVFDFESNVTIGAIGFAYAKVRATTTGSDTNVPPLSLNQILPAPPAGHKFVLNEFKAQGGADNESDDLFRIRIEQGVNILATGTLAQYEQVFMKINPRVLRLFKGGVTETGAFKLYVASVNGVDFSPTEFNEFIVKADEFLSLTESTSGLALANINYATMDISLRVELETGANPDDVRVNMQAEMQRLLDWRFWAFGNTVDWGDLLVIAKQTEGVKRVLDNYFLLNGDRQDVTPMTFYLPRLRSFTMYDASGVIISDITGVLSPAFYPNQPDFIIQQELLSSI